MSNEKISAIISLSVAIAILIANYYQWWSITYNGKMVTKNSFRIFLGLLIISLIVALVLIVI